MVGELLHTGQEIVSIVQLIPFQFVTNDESWRVAQLENHVHSIPIGV